MLRLKARCLLFVEPSRAWTRADRAPTSFYRGPLLRFPTSKHVAGAYLAAYQEAQQLLDQARWRPVQH